MELAHNSLLLRLQPGRDGQCPDMLRGAFDKCKWDELSLNMRGLFVYQFDLNLQTDGIHVSVDAKISYRTCTHKFHVIKKTVTFSDQISDKGKGDLCII